MAHRQRIWGKRLRDAIIVILGNRCVRCRSKKDIEIDLINPIADLASLHHRHWNISQRATFWRRQLMLNNLQLLCSKCNAQKGAAQTRFDLL